jgi:hypothetical protein
MVQVQQGQARDRPDRGTRPGDIQQRRGQPQVSASLFQFPGQIPERCPAHLRAGKDSDGVRPESFDDVRNLTQAGDRGYSRDGIGSRLVGQACRHHRQAVIGLPPQDRRQVSNYVCVPGHHNLAHAEAEPTAVVQPPSQVPPRQQVEHCGRGQSDDNVASGQPDFRRIRTDRHACGQAHPDVEHAPELIGAHAEKPGVVAAGQRDCGEPDNRECEAEPQVCPGSVRDRPESDLECHQSCS